MTEGERIAISTLRQIADKAPQAGALFAEQVLAREFAQQALRNIAKRPETQCTCGQDTAVAAGQDIMINADRTGCPRHDYPGSPYRFSERTT